jgi:hypothetical protein
VYLDLPPPFSSVSFQFLMMIFAILFLRFEEFRERGGVAEKTDGVLGLSVLLKRSIEIT